MTAKSDNTRSTDKPKRKAPKTAWKPGQSGNPNGAPKRGEAWSEIIKKYGDMTPVEIAEAASSVAGQLKKIGGGITMKEAVVIRIFAALMFEPTQGLWTSLMERTDGKVLQAVDLTTKGEKIDSADDTRAEILRKLASIAAATGADEIPKQPE